MEPDEIIRTLQITGGSTYVISLPKKWIRELNIEQGTQIKIQRQKDHSLLLIPENKLKKERKDVKIIIEEDEEIDTIIRKLIALYLSGYKNITIRSTSERIESKHRNILKEFIRKTFVGTEILTDSANEIVLQVLVSYPELSISMAINRMSLITASMHRDAITALREMNKELAQDVINTDDEVDRFNLYVIRLLKMAAEKPLIMKELNIDNPKDCVGYRVITKSVERTADHATKISQNILMLKKPLDTLILDKIIDMSEMSIDVFENAIDSLFKQDYGKGDETIKNAKKIIKMENELNISIDNLDIEERTLLKLIIDSISRTAEYASDIGEVVLNLHIEKTLIRN